MEDGTFKKGEIAQFQRLEGAFAHLNSEECEILETPAIRKLVDLYGTHSEALTYLVDYRGLAVGVPPEKLKKKPGKRQTRSEELRTMVPWSTVAWTPHKQPVEV